jgi:hypothetical protein
MKSDAWYLAVGQLRVETGHSVSWGIPQPTVIVEEPLIFTGATRGYKGGDGTEARTAPK